MIRAAEAGHHTATHSRMAVARGDLPISYDRTAEVDVGGKGGSPGIEIEDTVHLTCAVDGPDNPTSATVRQSRGADRSPHDETRQ